MSIYCDLCHELLTHRDEVDERHTFTFEDNQTADLCATCGERPIKDLSSEQLRLLLDASTAGDDHPADASEFDADS